jgi:hypothetical protein
VRSSNEKEKEKKTEPAVIAAAMMKSVVWVNWKMQCELLQLPHSNQQTAVFLKMAMKSLNVMMKKLERDS